MHEASRNTDCFAAFETIAPAVGLSQNVSRRFLEHFLNRASNRFLVCRGAWMLAELRRQLGMSQAIGRVLKKQSFRTQVERALFAMVANRALAPASKLAVKTWVQQDVALPGVEAIPVQQLYRAMDALIEVGDALQEKVFSAVANLLNLEVDLLFCDTTSTYFETEGEDPEEEEDAAYMLRRHGHSKGHRPDLAQAVIGLAMTRDGIPERCWVWPGNTADVTRIAQVKQDLAGWQLGRVVTVVDRGFTSEQNLRTLQRAGGHYIAGERLLSGRPAVEEALSRAGRYQKVRENVEVKEILVGDGEARQRFVLVRNPQEEARSQKQRAEILAHVQEELDGLSRLGPHEHTKAVCRLLAHPTYGRYLKQDKHGRPQVDRAKVEAAFRTLKQTLELRPVYHRLSRRIRAHVLLCWLALLLLRVAEVRVEEKLGQRHTGPRLRAELGRMHLGVFEGRAGTVYQRTETAAFQRQIFSALGVDKPPRFFRIDPRKGV